MIHFKNFFIEPNYYLDVVIFDNSEFISVFLLLDNIFFSSKKKLMQINILYHHHFSVNKLV